MEHVFPPFACWPPQGLRCPKSKLSIALIVVLLINDTDRGRFIYFIHREKVQSMSDFIESEAEESEEELEEKDLKPKKTQRFLEDDGKVF